MGYAPLRSPSYPSFDRKENDNIYNDTVWLQRRNTGLLAVHTDVV